MATLDHLDAVMTADFAGFKQFTEHSTHPIDAATGGGRVANQAQESFVLNLLIRLRVVHSTIVAATVDFKHTAHGDDPVLAAMLFDEEALYSDSLAKYRAAYFRISLLASTSSAACFSDLSGVTALIHL